MEVTRDGILMSVGPISPSLAPAPSPTSSPSTEVKDGILIPLVIFAGISAAVFLSYILLRLCRAIKRQLKQRKSTEQCEDSWQFFPDSPVRFTHEILKTATEDFDMRRKLGHGGFGSVFEGTLNDGTKIAVKRLERIGQGRKEFVTEVKTIGSIHHVNLVKLVGFCAEGEHRLLAYEYMSNGSLDKWIFCSTLLEWTIRKKIVLHIARGLAYLHEECHKRIAHLDVKPQNVLLDDEFNATLSDFGLATLIDRDKSFVMTQMRGTPGYLAPEWLGGRISEKVDVYSYGVVALEVIFGRKNMDYSPGEEGVNLLTTLVKTKAEEDQLFDLLSMCSDDMQQDGEEVQKMIKLAIWCLHTDAATRPAMSTVVKILEGSLSVDVIRNYFSPPIMLVDRIIDSTTQLSASVLSGPR